MRFIMGIANELKEWLVVLLGCIPGFTGVLARRVCYKPLLKSCGKTLSISANVSIAGLQNIALGDCFQICSRSSLFSADGRIVVGNRVLVNTNSTVNAENGGEVIIGDDVVIAQNVVIRAADHRFDNTSKAVSTQGHAPGRICIGSGCWIAANCVITRDVTIGENSVVAAGSVVTADVPPRSIVGGVPAKVLYER